MNNLQLSTELAKKADVPYDGFTDVEAATGELGLVVTWIKDACLDIQTQKRGRWKFLHQEYTRTTRATKALDVGAAVDNGSGLVGIPITGHGFSASDYVTLSGTTNYDGTHLLDATTSTNEIVITATYAAETFAATDKASVRDYEFYTADGIQAFDEDSFYYYLKTDGANQKRKLRYVDYHEFKAKYLDFSTEGAPSVITITPDKKLRTYPSLDNIYVITADGFQKPQTMTENSSTPPYPDNFHMLTVWKALIDYGGFEESSPVFTFASFKHDNLFDRLVQEEEYKTVDMIVRPV